ncbi:hypothetical protein BD779DRAFT_1641349 [Infundibulicybe gibba]|nr:hypothetical protein BD779DRAFT_1641349 [Infundibulicybe gibba]
MTSTTLQSQAVLGKRKAELHPKSYIIRLGTASPEIARAALSDSDANARSAFIAPASLDPDTRSRRRKTYCCTHTGCTKSYTKPSRLAEHERSHSGDRPFECETCKKTYLRDTHLHAHQRTHLPESERPLVCPQPGCGKRFWTTQHLRVHVDWHNGMKPFICSQPSCGQSFSKNYQLRAHISSAHSPPDTKPYQCTHTGCTKSFNTNQHLQNHTRIHDEKRYVCVNGTCLPSPGSSPSYFPTWTALQHHLRTSHPPTCTSLSCNGRTFSTQKGLRAHQRLHEQQAEELHLNCAGSDSDEDVADKPSPRKRRRGGELGRDWICEYESCRKDFKSKKALKTHTDVTHLGRRDFVCTYTSCNKSYGYKHLLQRHTAKAHTSMAADSSESASGTEAETESSGQIEMLTGKAYTKRLENSKALPCSHPRLVGLLASVLIRNNNTDNRVSTMIMNEPCDFVFYRAYDLRRHLKTFHNVEVDKVTVDNWVRSIRDS